MALVVQIILATLVDDSHEIILGRSWIRENPIDFSPDQGCLIVGVIDADRKFLRRQLDQWERERCIPSLLVLPPSPLGRRVPGNIPSREDQDGRMALQSPGENLGSLDAKTDAIVLNGGEGGLRNPRQPAQLILAIPL
jgi:hypothetical protein